MVDISRTSSSSPGFQPVKHSKSSEETQHSSRQIGGKSSADRAKSISNTDHVQSSKPTTPKPTPFKPEARPLGDKDIMNQLFHIKRPPTPENKQLLSTMIQHGIAATAEAFDMIQTLIKGKKKTAAMQSAVISYAKGLGKSARSADILASYFANETDVLNNLKKLQTSSKQFQSILTAHQHLFNAGLFTGLSSIINEFDESLKKLMKQNKDNAFSISQFKRGRLVHEYKLLSEFLGGIESKLSQGSADDIALIKREFKFFKRSLQSMIQSLVSQSILSKDMASQGITDPSYFYWQIPNPMAPTERTIDLLIQKDKQSTPANINPDRTRIILKFETPDLGEVSVIIDFKENKVSYVFQTENNESKQLFAEMSADLKDRMSVLNYDLVSFQTIQKKLDIKKLLIPTLNLDKLTRIIAEA